VYHDGPPLSYAADAPFQWYLVPEHERNARCILESEVCVIDRRDSFIKGNVEIPLVDKEGVFAWTVWVSLSESNFRKAIELWDNPRRTEEPPYFGWLSTRLAPYPDTLNLKTKVHTRPVGIRPSIELEPTDHPLAVEQRLGLGRKRVLEIAEAVRHQPDE